MATTKLVSVRARDGSVEIPAILHHDGMLEFAAGNRRQYDADVDSLCDALPWQEREFWGMRA